MTLAAQDLPVPSEGELISLVKMQSEGVDFTELRRLARALGLRAEIEFPKDSSAIPRYISEGKSVIAQIDRFPLDREVARHAVVILGASDGSVTFLDPLKSSLTPAGERSVTKELFDDIHELSLICEKP